MSEEIKNNEIKNEEVNDQAPAAEQQKPEEPKKDDKPEKVGFFQKVKTFGKEKVLPTAKLVGKGVVTGVSMAGAALGTAYLIGCAIGGYSAAKGNTDEEKTDEDGTAEVQEAEKPADQTDDVQVSLNEANVNVSSNIE